MKRTVPFLALLIAILLTSAPSLAASFSLPMVDRALDSAVRIEITLTWPKQSASFTGSGWTRSCELQDKTYRLIVATAGHVIDVDDLTRVCHPTSTRRAQVKVVVIYRDGRQLTADREDALRVDRLHDYGEISLSSPLPCVVLPVGQAVDVYAGTDIFSIASPGAIKYGFFSGHVILKDATIVRNAPQGAWLVTMPVAPGASGAPVLDDRSDVVATVIGYVEWSWGGTASIVSALPPSLWALTPIQYQRLEVTQMGFIESLIPVLKLGGVAAIAASLVHSTIALLHLGPKLSQETFDVIMAVSQTAVNAVEQAHGDLASIDKKQLAQQMVSEILAKLGINAPQSLIDAGIESAVLALNHVFGQKAA